MSTMEPVRTEGAVEAAAQVVSPIKLAHVVFRTSKYRQLVDWYKLVLSATPAFENEGIAFLAYDDEHHRIALINTPGLEPQRPGVAGVHHVAFTYETLGGLLDNYERLKSHDVRPVWCVNHGPTTSMYYVDPDGNQVEFQVDNCDTVEEAGEFFFTDEFSANPLGVDFDPEELLARYRAGEDETALKTRPDTGPRDALDSPLH